MYKCLNLQKVIDIFNDKYNLSRNLLWDWEQRMLNDDNIKYLFPDVLTWTLSYEHQKKEYAKIGMEATKMPHSEWRSVMLIPKDYDASKDEVFYNKRKKEFIQNMKEMTIKRGKKWTDKDEKDYLDNVNFGKKNFNDVNKYLSKMYELYGEYYENNVIKCYLYDDDYTERELWGYPVLDYEEKALFISELESWIESFDMDTTGFYEWVLRCNFVEGRYWQRVWNYDLTDKNFREEEPPENIKKINEMLRQLYKKNNLPIFTDYYVKVDEKIFD